MDGSVVGSVAGPRQEGGRANVLAMHKSTAKFYDVASTERLDFVCQYRAPAPCTDGYRYYAAPPVNSSDSD